MVSEKEKMTTKKCPNCGNENLLRFVSQNRKACTDCHTWIPWHLEPGQKPLFD